MLNNRDKERSSDRIISLRPIEGVKTKDGLGNVDPSLFRGDNRVHIMLDGQSCLWSIRYEKGTVPEVFKQRFTSYAKTLDHVQSYFKKRGLEIESIED